MPRLRSLLPVSLSLFIAVSAAAASAPRPNIVFFVADDPGYGDLGFTGNPVAKTPHLDRLAAESSQPKDHHVAININNLFDHDYLRVNRLIGEKRAIFFTYSLNRNPGRR